MTSLEKRVGNLVVFYYLGASEIWLDKRGGLWWGCIRRMTSFKEGQFSSIFSVTVHLKSGLIKGVVFGGAV